jgi:hypothetical protein
VGAGGAFGHGITPSTITDGKSAKVEPKGTPKMELITEILDQLNAIPPILIFMALLIPFAILWLVTFIYGYFIARRKGIGVFGALIGTFPVWSIPVLVWWASITDKAVLDRLNKLEGRG